MASVVDNFWKGKRVFLTGHTGFKGSWLSIWLNMLGAEVTGYALKPSTSPALFDDASVEGSVESHIGDVRDLENLKKIMAAANPEIVIHMAAQPLVRYSYSHPVETYMTNVMGTVHFFEAVKICKSVRAVVNVTTDKCYENLERQLGYLEGESMGGYDPYSSSKGCSELVTSAYRQSYFGLKNDSQVFVGSARAGNVIGGGDWSEDRLVPDIVRSIVSGNECIVRNPKSIRPWQHVLEPLNGYLMLAEKLYRAGEPFAEAFNFGPEDSDAKEVEWIAKVLTQSWGPDARYRVQTNNLALHEAHFLKLISDKAKTKIGWWPVWDLKTALEKIVDWNRLYLNDKSKTMDICCGQIENFMESKRASSELANE